MEEDISVLKKILRSLDVAQLNIWKQEKYFFSKNATGSLLIKSNQKIRDVDLVRISKYLIQEYCLKRSSYLKYNY